MDWSDDFFVIRRFGASNARAILYLQDQVVVIEEKLRTLDLQVANDADATTGNGSFRRDRQCEKGRQRDKLVRELVRKLKSYSKCSDQ